MNFQTAIEALFENGNNTLFGKSYLNTNEMSDSEIVAVVNGAFALKDMRSRNISPKIFDSGIAVSMFSKKDLGMDLAYASGSDLLGLSIIDMDKKLGTNAITETATLASFMADTVGVCESDYIEKSSRYIKRIDSALSEQHYKGILAQKPCVLNLGSDEDSPVQTLADLEFMADKFGRIENLKGKKIAISWVYSPDGTRSLATPQGLLSLLTRFGMNVVLAAPEGMELMPDAYEKAKEHSEISGGTFTCVNSINTAFEDADIVIPMNWAPFSFLEKRTELSAINMGTYIDLLEHELRENSEAFIDWEVTESLMETTRDGKALLLHSLPADITDISCIRGEMTAQVYGANLDSLLSEAGMRPFVIASMILLSKSENPKEVLSTFNERANKRYF